MKLLKLLAVVIGLAGMGAGATLLAQTRSERVPETRNFMVLAGRGAEIGVSVADGTDGGVKVEEVTPDSPADKAGVKKDDVFVEFDGEHVRGTRQFARLVQETPSGRTVKATVMRAGQRKDVQITPGEGRSGANTIINGDRMRERMGDLGSLGDLGDLGGAFRTFRGYIAPFGGGNFNFDIPVTPSGARLGVTVDELTSQLAKYFGAKDGVLVTEVTDGSAAERAGIKAGDIITSVNGHAVTSREDLVRDLRDGNDSDVKVGIVRDRKELIVTAKIEAPRRPLRGARPA
jgi:serine protease Do